MSLNESLIPVSPKEWLNYLEDGVIRVEFTPSTEDKYAFLSYSYEAY